jgi:hypothetical protein
MTDPFHRDYRAARQTYGLPADQALAYARNRRTLLETELVLGFEVDWQLNATGDRRLVALLVGDLDGNVLAAIGGVDVECQVSDHGNLNLDDHDPYLTLLAAELVREVEAA